MTSLVLVLLAQTSPPLVQASETPAAPYVVREHGEVCVVEPAPNGGELRHCRKEGTEYTGAPAPTPGAVKEAPDAEHDRPPSQFGFAMKLGASFPIDTDDHTSQASTAIHGRIGARYALLDRSQKPGRGNLAFALLGGGDVDGRRGGLGVEGRIEATAGGESFLLEPVFVAFVSAGAQYLMVGQVPEFHAGGGISFDLLFSGMFSGAGHVWLPLGGGNGTLAAAVLFLLAPTLEYRYVVRGDGTHYNALLLSMGL
ncbi:MAG: hypothetical protein QM723_29490 [Myxococcaceae bacterium]